MLDVHLTPQMQEFAEREVAAGRYADVSDVVQAAMRKLMEERGEAAFLALKAELEAAAKELEGSGGTPFDPRAFEPRAFRSGKRVTNS